MLLAIAIVLAAATNVDLAAVQVGASLDAPETPWHRPARYVVTAEAPEDVELRMPSLDAAQMPGIEVREEGTTQEAAGEGRKRVRRAFRLDPIQAGNYAIPPVEVSWGEGEGATREVVPGMVFRARELTDAELAAAQEFVGLAAPPPLEQSTTGRGGLLFLAIAAAVGCVVTAAYLLAKRRAAKQYVFPPEPAWDVALKRLAELSRRQLIEKGIYETFYVDLSSILRYYIEDRFSLHAPERTTPEFLEESGRTASLSDEYRQVLGGFLRHCDRVKFALYKPAREEMEHSFALVKQFINETIVTSELASLRTTSNAASTKEPLPAPSTAPGETSQRQEETVAEVPQVPEEEGEAAP